MEKCRGVELQRVWDGITARQKATIINKLVGFETAFASSNFPKYGSLYYKADLDAPKEDQNIVPQSGSDSVFAVGLTTARKFFDHGRSEVATHRGPWSRLEEYTGAVVQRELACLECYSQFPEQEGFYNGPGQYQPSTNVKTRALKNFEKVFRYLSPKDPILSQAVLWRTDLHLENIFVAEQDPTEITGIIDWQAVHVAPMFLQAYHPKFLKFDGEKPEGFDPGTIKLPDNFEDLNEAEQETAEKLRNAQALWRIYELELVLQCDDVRRAIRFSGGLQGRLQLLAGNLFSDGEPLMEEHLIQLQQQWSQAVDGADPSPLHFTEEERATHKVQLALWLHSMRLMSDFLEKVGGHRGWEGWVPHQQYDVGKENMKLFQEEYLARYASTKAGRSRLMDVWPFKG